MLQFLDVVRARIMRASILKPLEWGIYNFLGKCLKTPSPILKSALHSPLFDTHVEFVKKIISWS
jgi:hypothetical protein